MPLLKTITAQRAANLVHEGAALIDIRGADEYAREQIPGARNRPIGTGTPMIEAGDRAVIFHCRSGARTAMHMEQLAEAAEGCEGYVLEGGLESWRKAGLPVTIDRQRPIEIQRQVQIGAGSLVVLSVTLGVFVHPAFFALTGFVGAGLVFAGITGFCGMAKVLALMPWNRQMTGGAA